jgi:hypothetical protein
MLLCRLLAPDGRPREGLEKVRDYRGLHESVWNALFKIYGGGQCQYTNLLLLSIIDCDSIAGPSIVRPLLDIYGPVYTGPPKPAPAADDTDSDADEQQQQQPQQVAANGAVPEQSPSSTSTNKSLKRPRDEASDSEPRAQ